MSSLEFHPVADLFPLLDGAEFEALVTDIQSHGLRTPIILHPDGRILDGRNRYLACERAEVQPRYETWDGNGSAAAYVVSLNLRRRHLNESQRALVAARIANLHGAGRPAEIASIEAISQSAAADLLNVGRASVQRARTVLENGTPELVAAVERGEIAVSTAAAVIALDPAPPYVPADESRTRHAVHFSSETPEHYTPEPILTAVLACLGAIDLDPCSNPSRHVPAAQHFTEADNGLSQSWAGRVFMNPPYGRSIDDWITKLVDEHKHGGVTAAIALVPARTDTGWFARLRDYVCCFIRGRLTFVGNDDPAPFPSACFYLGEDIGAFYHAFSDLGDVWQRIEPGMFGE